MYTIVKKERRSIPWIIKFMKLKLYPKVKYIHQVNKNLLVWKLKTLIHHQTCLQASLHIFPFD